LPHSLRACWSTPVFSSQGSVIATFAIYYREPRNPSGRDQEIIEQNHSFGTGVAFVLDWTERLQATVHRSGLRPPRDRLCRQ
jgi:hypothetical protein